MLWVLIQGRGDYGDIVERSLGCSAFDWLLMEMTVFSSMTILTVDDDMDER